jgi:hypothetical protein
VKIKAKIKLLDDKNHYFLSSIYVLPLNGGLEFLERNDVERGNLSYAFQETLGKNK